LLHEAGSYVVKIVIIASLNLVLEFLMSQCVWIITQPYLQKFKMAAKSIETAENKLQDKFHYLQFGSYDRLHHANKIKSSAIWLVI